MLSTTTGIVHFATSITALIAGTIILWNIKGSKLHKQVGYVYCTAMLIVLVTSFMIYGLHGRFGILHWLAVISSVTLLAGMIPIWIKKPATYLNFHFSFMYWSIIGLYCAFVAEIFTRIPLLYEFDQNTANVFYAMVGIATALVGGIGGVYFRKLKLNWMALCDNFSAPREISGCE